MRIKLLAVVALLTLSLEAKDILPKSGVWKTKAESIKPYGCPEQFVKNMKNKEETLRLNFKNKFHPKTIFTEVKEPWKKLGENRWQGVFKGMMAKMVYDVTVLSKEKIKLKTTMNLIIPNLKSGGSTTCKVKATGYFNYIGK